MPFQKNGKRDYKRELQWEHKKKPERVKERTARNAARATLEKEGKVHKGDGKDVDHRTPLSKGGSTGKSNLRVVPASANRSFSRNANGSLKSQTSKRERKRK
jgi:hypothetical protein